MMAGYKRGLFDSFDEIRKFYQVDRKFFPSDNQQNAFQGYQQWKKIINKIIS